MTTVEANGVTLGVEHFGDAAAPLVLCAGGTIMLSWPDTLCESLARGGRHVVRHDLRDSGASTTLDPQAPAHTLRDLAADAAALVRELDDRPAPGGHWRRRDGRPSCRARPPGGVLGSDPRRNTTRNPGPGRDDLPDHDGATMGRQFSRSMPDWSDCDAVTEYAAEGAEILANDPAATRAAAARTRDRTPGTVPAVQMANQLGIAFARLDCKPRWRERLAELAMPTLVVHGRRDPFFPVDSRTIGWLSRSSYTLCAIMGGDVAPRSGPHRRTSMPICADLAAWSAMPPR